MLAILWTDVKNSICLIYCRAYGLYEEAIHVNPEREHVERTLFAEYKQKLNIEDETIPDLIDLKVGWIGEKNDIKQWPRLYFSDISRDYSSVLRKTDLINRLECDISKVKLIDISQISSLGNFQFIISQMNQIFVF